MVSLVNPEMLKNIKPKIEKFVMFNGTDIGNRFFKIVCIIIIIVLFCRYNSKQPQNGENNNGGIVY
jgi:type II secretory pathway component PulF